MGVNMEEQYEVRNGIAYRKPRYEGDADALYAYCDRCGSRPIVNNKCLSCDVPEPTEQAKRLAKVVEHFCFHRNTRGAFSPYSGHYESFETDLAAKIIAACTDDVEVHQATNVGFPQPILHVKIDEGAELDYVPPTGCDFIPAMPGHPVEEGTCVCAPEWGHNAGTYEHYLTSAPNLT